MARPRTHSDEAMLSAVRELLLEGGQRAVTIAAVSERSGAPTGTIYHRFGSRANLVAELWIRTIRRLHDAILSAADASPAGLEQAVAIGLATVDFCADHPDDARLLTVASRDGLRRADGISAENARALEHLNERVFARLREIEDGPGGAERQQAVVFAAVSLPYVGVQQALNLGVDVAAMRPVVERAARAALDLG